MYSDTESYHDAQQIRRSPGESFFDYKGRYRSPGESYYDSKKILRSSNESFYDKAGHLRSRNGPFYDGMHSLVGGGTYGDDNNYGSHSYGSTASSNQSLIGAIGWVTSFVVAIVTWLATVIVAGRIIISAGGPNSGGIIVLAPLVTFIVGPFLAWLAARSTSAHFKRLNRERMNRK